MIEEKHVVAVLASVLTAGDEIDELIPPPLFEFCFGRGLLHDSVTGPRITEEGRRWLQAVLR